MGSSEGGVGLLGLVFVLFLGLKLGGVIDWSWWWVFAPLWIPLGLVLVAFGVWAIIMLFKARKERIRFEKRWGKGSWR